MITQKLVVAIVSACLFQACATGRLGPTASSDVLSGPRTLQKLSIEDRQGLLQRAHVWQPIDTRSLDLLAGPSLPARFRIDDEVACRYVYPDEPLTGNTPKFVCELRPDDIVKVKYGVQNGEVYAEVAASRLLWALGFKADRMYSTRVTCRACPQDPFAASKTDWNLGRPGNVSNHVFDPAAIEREGPGASIEVSGFEGWAWPELENVSQRVGGAPRAHVDALKLLAVFIQHSDSKPEQQDMVCADRRRRRDKSGNQTCASPWLVMKDLGGTFGKATLLNSSKMDLTDWSSAGIWKDGEQCIGDLPRSFTGSLEDPRISEAGRRFLAGRLMLLRDRQIRDLFEAARIERRAETMIGADGRRRPVTVDDWVRVFKRKRGEIVKARCAD